MHRTWAIILAITIFALSSNVPAVYWASSIGTNSSYWSIYRQSTNISFNLSSTVEGVVSPVQSRDRILSPYQSYHEDIKANDVRLRQRTSSLEGSYRSTDEIEMQSLVYPDEIEITVEKPEGSEIYTIEYKNEIWPVSIKASRTLDYSGRQINSRDLEVNNGDFIAANFLYNHRLSKEKISVIWLQRMNATVIATNDSILSAEFQPTKYLGQLVRANTTGIADLKYKLRSSQYDLKHQNYPALSEGEERYYGTYGLERKIEMRSVFERSNDTDDEEDSWRPSWLPCCYSGWKDMGQYDQRELGADAKGIFDCTCYNERISF